MYVHYPVRSWIFCNLSTLKMCRTLVLVVVWKTSHHNCNAWDRTWSILWPWFQPVAVYNVWFLKIDQWWIFHFFSNISITSKKMSKLEIQPRLLESAGIKLTQLLYHKLYIKILYVIKWTRSLCWTILSLLLRAVLALSSTNLGDTGDTRPPSR